MHTNNLAETLDSINFEKPTKLSVLRSNATLTESMALFLSVAKQAIRQGGNQ
jgi:hypothetical protein